MTANTTIAMILFAGNKDTADTLDLLLQEVKTGLFQLNAAQRPGVYCLYRRLSDEGRLFLVRPKGSPDSPLGTLSGKLSDQVTQFLDVVKRGLPDSGPVHLIIGAHGVPALGFHLTNYFELLSGHPPGAIASGSGQPDLTLDELATSLGQLGRLTSAILHTCYLSGIETMCALQQATFHIACENKLKGGMKFSMWFPVLADAAATPKQVADNCFASMTTPGPNAEGTFSSHSLNCIGLLNALNELGKQLCLQLGSSNSPAEMVIKAAKSGSSILNDTVDVTEFCGLIAKSRELPSNCRQASAVLAEAVRLMQFGRFTTETYTPMKDYGGISVYLPMRNGQYYSPELLPKRFRIGAPDWCAFLKAWGGPAA